MSDTTVQSSPHKTSKKWRLHYSNQQIPQPRGVYIIPSYACSLGSDHTGARAACHTCRQRDRGVGVQQLLWDGEAVKRAVVCALCVQRIDQIEWRRALSRGWYGVLGQCAAPGPAWFRSLEEPQRLGRLLIRDADTRVASSSLRAPLTEIF